MKCSVTEPLCLSPWEGENVSLWLINCLNFLVAMASKIPLLFKEGPGVVAGKLLYSPESIFSRFNV